MKPQGAVLIVDEAHPAAFRRLCVETVLPKKPSIQAVPAAFRRLCVETVKRGSDGRSSVTSRLQAAVC